MPTRRPLNFLALSALDIGNMVGAGIFLLPSALAAIGSITLCSWLITTVGTLFLAYIIIDLNREIRSSGGPFVFAQEAFGKAMGFVIAYIYCLAWCIGNAAMAVAAVGYLGEWIPMLRTHPMAAFLAKVGIVWVITGVNILGIKETTYFQIVTTIIKLIPLVAVGVVGLFYVEWSNITQHFNIMQAGDGIALMAGLAITLWAYIGFESAIILSEETEGAASIKKATLAAFIVVAFLYVIGSFTLMGMIPSPVLQKLEAPYANAAMTIFGPPWDQLVNFCTIVSIVGALNGSILISVHSAFAAAKKRFFPQLFAAVNRAGTPVNGFVVSAIIMSSLLLLTYNQTLMEQFKFIVLLSTFPFLISYFLFAAAYLVVLQRKEPLTFNLKYTVAFLGIFYSLFTMVGAGQQVVFYGIFLFFLAFVLYGIAHKAIRTQE